jgi:hypothetical protein
MNDVSNDPGVMTLVRRTLLRLAADEEHMADVEAATVPYWATHGESVIGHRAAARALRQGADRLLPKLETASFS